MKINFDKIICINSGSLNDQQLFAVCETYFIGFEAMRESKMSGVTMEWLDEERETVAFVLDDQFIIGPKYNPLSKKDYDRIKKIKPVKTPKMPKTTSALNNYKAFLSEGFDIKTKSMDSKLNFLESKKVEEQHVAAVSEVVESESLNIEELKQNLSDAIENEDYELASILRDEINKRLK